MMTPDKFTSFASSLLATNSIHVFDGDKAPIGVFLIGGDASALSDIVFGHRDRNLSLSVHSENSDSCLGGIQLIRDIEDHSGEQVIFIAENGEHYHVCIEGVDAEIIDIMYGAGMTDAIAKFETPDLFSKEVLFNAMASNYPSPDDVPKEALKQFLNEFTVSNEMMQTLNEKGTLCIDGDYWKLRITNKIFKVEN